MYSKRGLGYWFSSKEKPNTMRIQSFLCLACLTCVVFSCVVSFLLAFFTSLVGKYLYTIQAHPVNVDRHFSFLGTFYISPFWRKCEKFASQSSSLFYKYHRNHTQSGWPNPGMPIFQFATYRHIRPTIAYLHPYRSLFILDQFSDRSQINASPQL